MQSVTVALVAVLVCFALADKEEIAKKHKAIIEECGKTFSISKEIMDYAKANKMTVLDETSEDQRCFIECIMQKHGEVKNGNYDIDGTLSLFDEIRAAMKEENKQLDMVKVRAAIQECTTKDGSGKCMKNYLIYKCIFAKFEGAMDSYVVA